MFFGDIAFFMSLSIPVPAADTITKRLFGDIDKLGMLKLHKCSINKK